MTDCTYTNGVLSDNKYHPEHAAWFANELFKGMAEFGGLTEAELIAFFVSDRADERAEAWRIVGEYHGFENLDHYPLRLSKKEMLERQRAARSEKI